MFVGWYLSSALSRFSREGSDWVQRRAVRLPPGRRPHLPATVVRGALQQEGGLCGRQWVWQEHRHQTALQVLRPLGGTHFHQWAEHPGGKSSRFCLDFLPVSIQCYWSNQSKAPKMIRCMVVVKERVVLPIVLMVPSWFAGEPGIAAEEFRSGASRDGAVPRQPQVQHRLRGREQEWAGDRGSGQAGQPAPHSDVLPQRLWHPGGREGPQTLRLVWVGWVASLQFSKCSHAYARLPACMYNQGGPLWVFIRSRKKCNRIFFPSRPFNEIFKFLENCPYDFHWILHSHSTPKGAHVCAIASKWYDWIWETAKIVPKWPNDKGRNLFVNI